MTWSTKRRNDLAEDINLLLGDFCTEWGFCNRLDGQFLLAKFKQLSADDFADSILIAEGFEPQFQTEWRTKFRRKFIERYKENIISMETYCP